MIRQWILGWSHTFQTNLALQHRGLPAAQQDCRRAWCPIGRDIEATHMQISLGTSTSPDVKTVPVIPSENGARTKALSIFPDRCAADLVHPPAIGGLPVSCVPWAALGGGLDVGHCAGH